MAFLARRCGSEAAALQPEMSTKAIGRRLWLSQPTRPSPPPPPPQASKHEAERAPRLPVRGADVDAWVADVQQDAVVPVRVPLVAGITVVDELELERQRQEEEQERQQEEQQQQQRRQQQDKKGDAAGRQRPPTGLEALRGIKSQEQRRAAAKQQMATAAQQVLQDPAKGLSQLKQLLELLQDEDAQVRRGCIGSIPCQAIQPFGLEVAQQVGAPSPLVHRSRPMPPLPAAGRPADHAHPAGGLQGPAARVPHPPRGAG